jgi:hypothetical protein
VALEQWANAGFTLIQRSVDQPSHLVPESTNIGRASTKASTPSMYPSDRMFRAIGVNEHNEEGELRKMEGALKFLFTPDSCFMVVEAEQILQIIAKYSSAVDMSGNVKGSDDI